MYIYHYCTDIIIAKHSIILKAGSLKTTEPIKSNETGPKNNFVENLLANKAKDKYLL